jgi:outer membrane protein assembly factor BamB
MRGLLFCTALLTGITILPSFGENWPCFRGPTRQGVSSETGLPMKWSEKENVLWRTAIPGEAWSSPIVWGENLYVTTATEGGVSCWVLALDCISGRVHWDKEVFKQKTGHKQERNTYATPTPATDGERIYAVFGDGSFVALDTAATLSGRIATFRFTVSMVLAPRRFSGRTY